MKNKFKYLLGFSALLIAACSGYYSVFGLSELFSNTKLAVIIMASSLEFAKIIGVSFLHNYWKRITIGLKIYLTISSIVLVTITSAGIYGFLSSSYQKTANKLDIHNEQFSVLDTKKQLYQKSIDDNQKIIESKNKRIDQLSNLRTNQESRLDSAKNNRNKTFARGDIDNSSKEIQTLNNDIDLLNNKNNILNDSVSSYSVKELDLNSSSNTANDLGPLLYLSKLTGLSMDKVVNYFILLLICVFDPLSISLVLATNRAFELDRNDEITEGIKPQNKPIEPIMSPLIESMNPKNSSVPKMENPPPPPERPKIEEVKEEFDRDLKEYYEAKSAYEPQPPKEYSDHIDITEERTPQPKPNIVDRYNKIVESDEFKNTYEDKSMGESIEIESLDEVKYQTKYGTDAATELGKKLNEELEKSYEPVVFTGTTGELITSQESERLNPQEIDEIIKEEELINQQYPIQEIIEPVITTGNVKLEDIKEIKANRKINSGVPELKNNSIERIGSNKEVRNGDNNKFIFNKRRG
jgi:hypothetical protein